MAEYIRNKKVNIPKITQEISACPCITVALFGITISGETSIFDFKAQLSGDEQIALTQLVDNHDPAALAVEGQDVSINEIPAYAREEIEATYQMKSYKLETLLNDEGPFQVSVQFPYPIVILGGNLPVRSDMVGDELSFVIEPSPETNNVVGAITSPASTGDTSVQISDSAKSAIFKSVDLFLVNGQSVEQIGRAVSKVGSELVFENPLQNDYPAGAYLGFTYSPVPVYHLNMSPQVIEIGKNTLRGTYVPANSKLNFIYKNLTKLEKLVVFDLEIYI